MASKIQLKPGLSVDVIKTISALKNEPKWMLEFRLNAYKVFKEKNNPTWGPDLKFLNFNDYIYYASSLGSDYVKTDWKDVPKKIKKIFEELKVPENEAKYFSGSHDQYDSETVYSRIKKNLKIKKLFLQILKLLFVNIQN